MAGGFVKFVGELSTVQTTYEGEDFGALPDLPEKVFYNCLVVVDEDRIFTCGGVAGAMLAVDYTFVFSRQKGNWTRYEI